jgi:hypothetical protein
MVLRRAALGLAVVLATTTSALGAGAAQASSSTICVGLVLDGRTLGGDVSTGCATVKHGATGVDVLEALGHTVGFRQDGLICTIDDQPASGCSAVDDTHYWAYFHRAPGATSWTYSTEGASTYQPPNASTEGWVYRDGGALTPPENVPYSKVCATKATPSPTPHPTRSTRTPKPASPHRTHRASAAPPTPSATPSPTATRRHHHGQHRHGPGRQPTNKASSSPGLPLTRPPSPSGSPIANPGTAHSGGPGTALVVGIVIVVAIGGLAALRFRRSR